MGRTGGRGRLYIEAGIKKWKEGKERRDAPFMHLSLADECRQGKLLVNVMIIVGMVIQGLRCIWIQ